MTEILHITNGDAAVHVMRQAGITDDILAWRDVLHDGPVPGGLPFADLCDVRADYILSCGWGSPEQIRQRFAETRDTLATLNEYQDVVLWFEHDLYDQLQLIQILHWFSEHPHPSVSLICTETYLGPASPDELLALKTQQQTVGEAQLHLAVQAWQAFTDKTPRHWERLLSLDTTALPFLHDAVWRLLQEYPDSRTGLSQTESQALQILAYEAMPGGRLFGINQQREERIYMGDSSFWQRLHGLLNNDPPLIELPAGKTLTLPTSPDQCLSLTPAGHDVLTGKTNRLKHNPQDFWIGGVHITPQNLWLWDHGLSCLVQDISA